MPLPGTSRDELCGQFFAALEKIRYFRIMPDGTDDPAGVEKAIRLFHDALAVDLSLLSLGLLYLLWLEENEKEHVFFFFYMRQLVLFQEMEKSGCQEYNTKNLAETLKSKGI